MVVIIEPLFKAKNGHTLRALLVVRVSDPGPGKQDIRSNDDQQAKSLEWLKARTDLPLEIRVVAGSGSGEHLDRNEYIQLLELVETGLWDLVICEDLGRIVRRIQAHLFAELCVDHNTRLISINDFVDTAIEGWQDRSIFSAWHHEKSNRDTSERIKRTHRNRFAQGGALPPKFPPGFIKPTGAKHDSEVTKDAYWEPIYDEWFTRLERGEPLSQVADWLNEIGAPTGCEPRKSKKAKDKYDCHLVSQRTRNPLLKGQRVRNDRESIRVNSSGRRRSVKASPDHRLTRFCPHLVFIDPDRYDRVIAILDANNGKLRVKGEDGRKNRPRKRTRAMGQQSHCAICGRIFVFGAHGQRDRLMCDGARKYSCWNGASLDGPLAARNILSAVIHELEHLKEFDETFVSMLNEEARLYNESQNTESAKIERDISRVKKEADNVLAMIRGGSTSQLLDAELRMLESELAQLRTAASEIERNRKAELVVPTAGAIRARFQSMLGTLPIDGLEFAHHFRTLIPRIVVQPVRLCTGGQVLLRATLRLQLAALIDDAKTRAAMQSPFERILTVDLFTPPQHERFRVAVMHMRAHGETERTTADALGISIDTAKKAAKLQREMDHLGIDDPYLALREPPEGDRKIRRHIHPRYRFDPLENPVPL